MSHYTVLVVTEDRGDVEKALAPFDEELRVDFVEDDSTYDGEPSCDVDEQTGKRGYWHNDQAKWDWWVVGGRWSNKFILKDNFAPDISAMFIGEDGRYRTDQAQVRDIDFEAMKEVRRMKAIGQLADYVKAVEEHGPVPSRDWIQLSYGTPEFELGKRAFWEHPTIKALGVGITGPFEFDDLDYIEKSSDGWVRAEETQAVTGWGLLTHDGHWLEQGSMGWFGASDTTMNSRIGYLETARTYIDGLGDDMWLTNVDVHI